MLQRNGENFCTGECAFHDAPAAQQETAAKLFVRVRVQDVDVLAQLDTGAVWSVVEPELAEALGLLDSTGPEAKISTRLGIVTGRLERVPVTFVASAGNSLNVEATVFVSREWPAGTFIGWNGLLERVRFGVDPRDGLFYFGAS
jgi:hypothetical protein